MSKCLLCNSKHRDPRCGEFIEKRKIAVHEFCLYLSSALLTNGDDNNGLYGFLPEDIYTESRRVSQLDCVYCRKPYANIGCCHPKCRHSFHTLCGIENGCENQFAGTFRSFCKSHIHKLLRKTPPLNETCCICYDTLREPGKETHYVDCIEAPCCRNGWFHRNCLQGFAKSAGYFFKCPLCNNTNKFKNEMLYRGIFVPEKDAAWELEPNAFSELLERPSECGLEICKHKQGRTASDDSRDPLLYCETCGAVAVHQNCLPIGKSDFICQECANVTERVAINEDSGRESIPPNATNGKEDESENEEIDICAISESDDDFLERSFPQRNKPPITSDRSDMKHLSKTPQNSKNASNLKEATKSQSPNSIEKRFHYDSSGDSDSSDEVRFIGRSARLYNIEEADTSSDCMENTKRKKNLNFVIDSTDEDECISKKRTTNAALVIDSSDEDSDENSNAVQCLAKKRRRIMLSDESSAQNIRKKRTSTTPTARQALPSRFTNIEEYQDFSANLNSNNEEYKRENTADVSCIAKRTRHRKSVSLNDQFNAKTPDIMHRATEKQRTSSSSSNESSSLGYSSTTESSASITSSTVSSHSSVRIKYKRRTAPLLQTSSSSSSISSTEESSGDTSSVNNLHDISCIARRTRYRRSNC